MASGDARPAPRVKTLWHELAHGLLHGETPDGALAELEAESVALVVCDTLGISGGAWSFRYGASWSGGGDEAIAAIKAAATRIQRTADRILTALQLEGGAMDGPVGNNGPRVSVTWHALTINASAGAFLRFDP